MNLAEKLGAGNFAEPLMAAAEKWGIVDPQDQARWLAQCSVETMGFKKWVESLAYSAPRLVAVFGTRNGLTPQLAEELVKQGQVAIGNHVYGGEWGRENLGNTQPNDGWWFRGRGAGHTTGRTNYLGTSMGVWGDQRLMTNPGLLETPEGAAQAGAWLWLSRKLNGVRDVRLITKRWNGGTNQLAERIAMTDRALYFANSA